MNAILSRLTLTRKFALLALIGILVGAIPSALYMREAGKKLADFGTEQQGMVVSARVLKATQYVQQHRGLASIYLSDANADGAKRAAKEAEADQAFGLVDSALRGINDPAIRNEWTGVQADWTALHTAVSTRTDTPPQSYAGHVAVIARMLKLNELVADYFELNLDPDRDTYELIQTGYYLLPALTEELGKTRAYGLNLLGKHAATADERFLLSGIVARAEDQVRHTFNAYDKAVGAQPAYGEKLAPLAQDAREAAARLARAATDWIIKPEALTTVPQEYYTLATASIDTQFKLNEAIAQQANAAIDAKMATLRGERRTMLITMLLLLASAGYLGVLVSRSVTAPLTEVVEIAQAVAGGDLSREIEVGAPTEMGMMLRALKQMNDGLKSIVGEVRVSAEAIGVATAQIAAGNADVSARLESQASSLEETASSMEELTSTVRQNADNAQQANELVRNASGVAERGGNVVAKVVETMGDINDSSRRIVDIIAVIDGIAFQTNILALNAAVEAARAGEQGRGFAVVASEVRNLAQRSAAAAKEIKELITRSVEKVEAGNQLAAQAGGAMDEILSSVKRMTGIISEIAVASGEQGSGIEQVNEAVTQMDDMTQQNAALVEQTAAASASLQDQAATLVASISRFTLGHQSAQATAPARVRQSHAVPKRRLAA